MRRAVRGGEGSWSVCVDALAYADLACGDRGGGEEGRPHVHGAVSEVLVGCDRGRTASGVGVVRKPSTALWPVARVGDSAGMTE
jgi:hypothetical protein